MRYFSNRMVAFLSVAVFVSSILWTLGLHTNSPQAMFPIWMSAHRLALGDLLALYLRSRWASRRNVGYLVCGFALAGAALVRLTYIPWSRPQIGMALQCGWDFLFAALLLGALLVGTSRFERWTRPRWLQFFGDISYGLYLVHVFVYMVYRQIFHPGDGLTAILVQFSFCSAVAIGLASLSRFTIEQWFLDLKEKPLFDQRTGSLVSRLERS